MNKYPLVTICIPTYNVENTIKNTLSSILKQSYKNISIKIVDNCSTDKTISIIKLFNDKRIKIYKFSKNVVAEENFNRCIKLSNGKYTAIYHSDDIYHKEIVYKQVCFLEKNKKAGVVFSEGELIDENDKLISSAYSPLKSYSDNFNYTYEEVLTEVTKNFNFLLCPTAMVRTKIYKNEVKRFRYNKFGHSSDLDAWLRIAKKNTIGIIKQKLIYYRISASQQTAVTRRDNKLPDFFKVMDFYLKNKKNVNKDIIIKDYLTLKTYFYLFLFIASIKSRKKKNERKLYRKFLNHKKKISNLYFSRRKFYIEIIYLSLIITGKFNFIKAKLAEYLYIKFYKV